MKSTSDCELSAAFHVHVDPGLFCMLHGLRAALAESPSITVFAAASTTNAVTDIARLFEDANGAKVRLSFASSSTLAKQIENGAPADVFLSANPKWMNYLEEKGRHGCLQPVRSVEQPDRADRTQGGRRAGDHHRCLAGPRRAARGRAALHGRSGSCPGGHVREKGHGDPRALGGPWKARWPGPRMCARPWSWWSGERPPWARCMQRMRRSATRSRS